MQTEQILQDALVYIDDNIKQSLSVEKLAARACFSTWHFSRLFKQVSGCSVMCYVRTRRLQYAAQELSSGRRILDIALEYGFDTHSGFSKAFRRYYGCTPETFRRHGQYAALAPPGQCIQRLSLAGGFIMQPKFVTLPARTLAGYVLETTTQNAENEAQIPMFWAQYMSSGQNKHLHGLEFVANHAEYGACFALPNEGGSFEYMIGLEYPEDAELPAGLQMRRLPAAQYAVFSTPPADMQNFSKEIQKAWAYIMNEWLPSSGYAFAENCVDYEYYAAQEMPENANTCDIYIPVVKR